MAGRFLIILSFGFLILFFGCSPEMPVLYDGTGVLRVICLWDSLGLKVPLRNAKCIIASEYGIKIYNVDGSGIFEVRGLPESVYSLSVRGVHPLDSKILLVGVKKDIEVRAGKEVTDTLIATPTSGFGVVINEIYSCGPVNNMFYFFDQFIELYNSSDSVRYLDGMIVMRVSGNNEGLGPGADEGNDGDIDGVTYAFRFPGKPGGREHPIYPGQFVVIASKAMDHRKFVSTSIDLSDADWEFYNQYSPNDIDNPNVPNLLNMFSHRTTEFLINLITDVVVVATGEDSVLTDGVDIETIVDGVEYQSNPHPVSKKTLDSRVDRGYVLSPPRYSGKSMQRKSPGFDTNDSSVDFEVIEKPTPKRQ